MGDTRYFEPVLHAHSDEPCCSFLRYGKVRLGGQTFEEALLQKYKPESMLSDEELKANKEREQADLYVNTDKKGGMKKIEILGMEQSY